LVANKIDVLEEDELSSIDTQLEELAISLNEKYSNIISILHLPTSAKTGVNVDEVFKDLSRVLVRWSTETLHFKMAEVGTIDETIPTAHLIAVNDIVGPMIISSSPYMEKIEDYSEFTQSSAIYIMNFISFDMDLLLKPRFYQSEYPWKMPSGMFKFIVFSNPNPEARTGYEIYLLGVVVAKKYEDVEILNERLSGAFHGVMNDFIRLIKEEKLDLVSKRIYFDEISKVRTEISSLLKSLREEIFNLYNG